jgi:hypothetical protein
MPRSWYTPLVVVFWCIATGWLVVDKILPTLRSRPPATYRALHAVGGDYPPVAWNVRWDDRPIGTAVSRSTLLPAGGLAVDSALVLQRVPLADVVPPWLRAIVEQGLPAARQFVIDARGRTSIDARGRLEGFRTTVVLPDSGETFVVDGTVTEGTLRVTLEAGAFRYETSRPIPESLLLADELAPHASLPGLSVGQRWTAPVFNPLRGGSAAVALLDVHVERETMLYADGQPVTTRLVAFTDESAPGAPPRLRLWVDRAGRVLRQEATLGSAVIAFQRRSDADAALLAEQLAGTVAAPSGAPPR